MWRAAQAPLDCCGLQTPAPRIQQSPCLPLFLHVCEGGWVHSLMACCALSLLVAARRMSPGLAAGAPLLKLRVLVLALHTLPDASDTASDASWEADSLRSAALTRSAALGAGAARPAAAACSNSSGMHQHRTDGCWQTCLCVWWLRLPVRSVDAFGKVLVERLGDRAGASAAGSMQQAAWRPNSRVGTLGPAPQNTKHEASALPAHPPARRDQTAARLERLPPLLW